MPSGHPHPSPRARARRRGPVAAALAAALAAGALAGGSHSATAAAASPDGPPTASQVRAGGGHPVTLITGDQVWLDPDGRVVTVLPAEGREDIPVQILESKKHTYVIPQDAASLIQDGTVDRRLFDAALLSSSEHRRVHQGKVPFIVEYEGAKPAAKPRLREAADPTVRRTFSHLAAEALSATAEQVSDVWKTVTRANDNGARTAASGVKSLRLDGVVQASLDKSVPQIGAPDAWDAGYDGTGTTVAVLDTGIDTSHPDLADGRVVAEKNFSVAEDTKDRQGHGTHVASTVAGTGAKSGGAFRGVAPGADLLNGKVLDDDGFGDESGIIAGMEWAVEQGAAIVNVSLGGPDSPGEDLMEQAVNTLSAEHGTLFVIAAGNSGPGKGTLESPGSADAALTVGAVDDEDALAEFSSVGPRVGDDAVKPDLTAPGVDIAAALAEGSALAERGEQVQDGYVALSGTSMATPHVAGVAALLSQQHPDWTGQQLKAALTGSAKPGDSSVYQQGSGRVDVPEALSQSVVTEPSSLSFGTTQWPHDDDEPVTQQLTYRNLGDQDVTLTLAAESTGPEGEAAPEGMFTLSAEEVTVPAGSTASVEVTADTTFGGSLDGEYGLVISGSDDTHRVRTVGAVHREAESYDLTMRVTDRDGQAPEYWQGTVLNHETGEVGFLEGQDGEASVRLPVGSYGVEALTHYLDEAEEQVIGTDWQVQPKLDLSQDTEVTFDGTGAEPLDLTVPDPEAAVEVRSIMYVMETDDGSPVGARQLSSELPEGYYTQQVGPSEPTAGLHSEVAVSWENSQNKSRYNLAYGQDGSFYTGLSKSPGADELAEMTIRQGATAEDRNAVLFTLPDTGGPGVGWSRAYEYPLPRTVTEYLNTDGVRWAHEMWQLTPDGGTESQYWDARSSQYTAGESYEKTFNVGVFGPHLGEDGGLFRTGNTLTSTVNLLADGAGHLGYSPHDTASTTLYREGEEYATVDDELEWAEFTLPEEEAEYRLETTLSRSGVASVSTSVTASYTFTSAFVEGDEPVALPISAVRFTPELALDSTAEAGAEIQVPVTVQGSAADEAKELTVSVSFDGGQSWEPLEVRDGQVTVVNPEEAGTGVSFRAEATDGDGNALVQTIIDAYRTASTA